MMFRGFDHLVHALETGHPHIALDLKEVTSREALAGLLNGSLDIGFMNCSSVAAPLVSTAVFREGFLACLPARHPLASQGVLRLSDLQNESFICFERAGSPVYFERIVTLCVEEGFTPRMRFQVKNWLTAIAMVSREMGVAIVPRSVQHTRMAGTVFRQIENLTDVSTIQCAWHQDRNSLLVDLFVKEAHRWIRPLASLGATG
jgi:DNA-binding transcriptional LysR family regulator